MQLPSRSTLAAGLTSVIGWAIVKYGIPVACAAAGGIGSALCSVAVNLSEDQVIAIVGGAATLAAHFTPDSLKDIAKRLDVDVKDVAAIMPQTYAEYPGDDKPPSKVKTNITTVDGQPVD